jgi:PhnB protein
MTTDNVHAAEELRIRETIEDWAEALRRKDAGRALSHYAPGVVHFSLAPPLTSSGADPDGLKAWFATWRGPIGYEIRDLAVALGGDLAFCHSLNRMSGTKTSGEANDLWFRVTLGLRKVAGAWKIAHEHESVPFYMDGSARAALDLEP